MKIGIIGAGATGLVAGYELAKQGHAVTLFEASPCPGGLASAFPVGGNELEQFYHHIFTSDSHLLELIEELGLAERLHWYSPRNGIYLNQRLYPFTSPKDLLLFRELSLRDRIAMGLLVFRAKFVKDWKKLETISARDWITQKTSPEVYRKVWGPLLHAKFDSDAEAISAVWIWNKFKLRGSSRGKGGTREQLGYLEGSFGLVYARLAERIQALGGVIRLETPVQSLRSLDSGAIEIVTAASPSISNSIFDKVIVTCAPEALLRVFPEAPPALVSSLNKRHYKANLCAVLELDERLSDYYWITVAQEHAPFTLALEHTNLVGSAAYGGTHIVYLSRYLDPENPLFTAPDAQVQESFLAHLKILFPHWDSNHLKRFHLHRARYAQPVVGFEYSKHIPAMQSPVPNLFLATMAQIYPEDRGQTYAVRLGKQVAAHVQK